jgi:hypothetical protein
VKPCTSVECADVSEERFVTTFRTEEEAKQVTGKNQEISGALLVLLFNPEDGNGKFLGIICELLPDYTAFQLRTLQCL